MVTTARFDPQDAPELIREARLDAGLTQAQLAQRAGLRQPSLAQMESGTRAVSAQMLERVLRAADYRPSLALSRHAEQIVTCARHHHLDNPRVFGSVLRGEDGYSSDIDILVTPEPGADLLDLALFINDVESLTGFPVDVVSERSIPDSLRQAAREAVPL